jgi:ABC-2 type transport system ATP-binding protein
MRRRLDLAMSLIASPPIIFLDEPTTGLDPRSRLAMWDMIKKLVAGGTTILLTTQYMDEADQLADDIVVIDNGQVIAEGTPSQLKGKVGADRLEVAISAESDFEEAAKVLKAKKPQTYPDRRVISLTTKGGVAELKTVLQILDDSGAKVESVELRRPTLDDVFLTLTGHTTEKPKAKKGRGKK